MSEDVEKDLCVEVGRLYAHVAREVTYRCSYKARRGYVFDKLDDMGKFVGEIYMESSNHSFFRNLRPMDVSEKEWKVQRLRKKLVHLDNTLKETTQLKDEVSKKIAEVLEELAELEGGE